MSLADQVVVMDEGRIRQSGAAALVYDQPADLFVAHFIGSPSMNFITGEIREDCFVAPGLVWPLAERLRPGPATLGVRPEFVRPGAKGRLRAEVVRDEYQGACRYIHLQAECGRLVMRVADREGMAVGASLGLDFARVLLFDPVSGKRL